MYDSDENEPYMSNSPLQERRAKTFEAMLPQLFVVVMVNKVISLRDITIVIDYCKSYDSQNEAKKFWPLYV